jgi:hypothetical protein
VYAKCRWDVGEKQYDDSMRRYMAGHIELDLNLNRVCKTTLSELLTVRSHHPALE